MASPSGLAKTMTSAPSDSRAALVAALVPGFAREGSGAAACRADDHAAGRVRGGGEPVAELVEEGDPAFLDGAVDVLPFGASGRQA